LLGSSQVRIEANKTFTPVGLIVIFSSSTQLPKEYFESTIPASSKFFPNQHSSIFTVCAMQSDRAAM